jgi:hypothetical protein
MAAIGSVATLVVLEAVTTGSEGWSVAWGPRRLTPMLPLLAIAGIPLFERLLNSRGTWIKAAAGLLVAVSAGIQLGGVLASKTLINEALDSEIGDFHSGQVVWEVRYSPIVYSWKLLFFGTAPDLALFETGRDDPAEKRFLDAAAFLEANVPDDGVIVVDRYLSPFWQFYLDYNGDRHIAWYSLPIPWEEYGPQRAREFQDAVAGLSEFRSIWIVSENPEFQVSENYEPVANLLAGYSLAPVEGFSDGPGEPSIIVFQYQRLTFACGAATIPSLCWFNITIE